MQNLFLPNQMVECINTIKSVTAQFLDHDDPLRPLHVGWDKLLKEQMLQIPSLPGGGYTKAHFFEFHGVQVSIRDTVDKEVHHVHTYIRPEHAKTAIETILVKLQGHTNLDKVTVTDVILPRHPVCILPRSKIESLAEKYFSIPTEYLSYYPKKSLSYDLEPSALAKDRALAALGIKNKVGRPTNHPPKDEKVSILF